MVTLLEWYMYPYRYEQYQDTISDHYPTADDGHICSGYGRLITSQPFRLGCSLG
jgi:hypothetical protein